MENVSVSNILYSVEFQKTGFELSSAMEAKIKFLEKKIEERKLRVEKICQEYDITDADIIEILRMKQSNRHVSGHYGVNSTVRDSSGGVVETTKQIPVGAVSNMEAEEAAIKSEKEQLARLYLINRNIEKAASHKVSLEDLKYLGF